MHVVSRCDSRIELRSRSSSNRWSMAWAKKANQDDRFGRLRRVGSSSGRVALLLFMAVTAAHGPSRPRKEQGIDSGNYNIKQSVEFGYRFTDFTGKPGHLRHFREPATGPAPAGYDPGDAVARPSRPAIRPALLEQLRIWRRSQQRLSSAHRQEQVVRLRRHLPPRRECLGLLAASQPAEPGQHVYQCSGGLQSHHQAPHRTCSTPGAAWATTT